MSQGKQNKAPTNKLEVVSVRLVRDAPIMSEMPIIQPIDAVKLLGDELCQLDRECLALICLKTNGVPACCSFCSLGGLNQSIAHPREIFKAAILANAASFIIIHNHPSNSLVASKEDILLTDRLVQLGGLIGIPLLDHIIVGSNNEEYFSFKEKDILPYPKNTYKTDYQEISFDMPEVAEPVAVKMNRKHR